MTRIKVDKKSLGLKIKYFRLSKNLTQEKLAEKIGVSEKYLSNIETARGNCSLGVFLAIANGLGVSTDELFDEQLFFNKLKEQPNDLISIITRELYSLSEDEKDYVLNNIKLIKGLNKK